MIRRPGLDQPLVAQFSKWVVNTLRGDLGHSIYGLNQPVAKTLIEALPRTLSLARLSCLGRGAGPDTPSWRLILADGRSFVLRVRWLGVFPGLAIMLLVLSIHYIGDALDVRECGL
ncbi:hypothetical protein [Maliponia aquimaris]|nr:hypothetical protein [Maliponia aquimaris]